jgi:ATP-binding cassette subfamily B protein RaxB
VVDGIMIVLTVLVMAWYSLTLTSIVLGATALYVIVRWGLYYPQRYATDEQLSHEAKSGTHFIETLRGMMAIKLNLRENERRAAYQNLVVDQVNAGVKVQNVGIAQRASAALIFGLENVAVIWLGAIAVMEGRFSVGMLYAFLGFKIVFLTRVNALVEKWNDFRMLDLHAERIADIALAEEERALPSMPGEAPTVQITIEAEGLAYAYGPEGFVFRGVDFSVAPGETVAIVGPSGCGKTTLIKVLVGLLEPTEGSVRVNGRNLKDWDLGHYRRRIGAVMQDDQLFVGTIEDNISFFDPEHDPERVRDCARLAMIDAEISAMPMGFNTIVGSLGAALSGGQKQRVLLARALYRRPQVLFLDEALDQLDVRNESRIFESLKTIDVAVVYVTHREPPDGNGVRTVVLTPTAKQT